MTKFFLNVPLLTVTIKVQITWRLEPKFQIGKKIFNILPRKDGSCLKVWTLVILYDNANVGETSFK